MLYDFFCAHVDAFFWGGGKGGGGVWERYLLFWGGKGFLCLLEWEGGGVLDWWNCDFELFGASGDSSFVLVFSD